MTCLPKTTRLVTLVVVVMLSMAPMSQAAESLPIIPGAAGFGMETPAGSGRHLHDVSLEDNWDASLVGHWDFDEGKSGGTLEGDAALVAHGQGKGLKLNEAIDELGELLEDQPELTLLVDSLKTSERGLLR